MPQATARAIGHHRHRAAADLDGALVLDGVFSSASPATQLFDVEAEVEDWGEERELQARARLAVAPAVADSEPEQLDDAPAERRTVAISGRPADPQARSLRLVGDRTRRRPSRTVHERLGPRPDRVAMWALLLGLFLVLVTVISN